MQLYSFRTGQREEYRGAQKCDPTIPDGRESPLKLSGFRLTTGDGFQQTSTTRWRIHQEPFLPPLTPLGTLRSSISTIMERSSFAVVVEKDGRRCYTITRRFFPRGCQIWTGAIREGSLG